MASSKLIIISTRLPITVSKSNGQLSYAQSTGGLATGMASVSKTRDTVWVGWPGIASDKLTSKDKQNIEKELKKSGCSPIFLTQSQIDAYYSGYCNATLWPLFHYFPTKARFRGLYWRQYKAVNQLFYKEAKKHLKPNATVWVHDYQLLLLPALLRTYSQKIQIGFFLHTPFPSYEIFRIIPEREELLEGVLGADLIGFHTYDYVRHFLSSVRRILGYENSLGAVRLENHVVQTDAFPIGIDYKWYKKKRSKRLLGKIFGSKNTFPDGTKVILSAGDRMDYTKGIEGRLDAFELFLKQYPEYLRKVVLVLHAAPSRTDVEEYQNLQMEIEQKVSHINGEFSSIEWAPVIYINRVLPLDEVVTMISQADVMLVTPIRDGMNLVAKEFVATKHKDKGVLILSEMAGVASELQEAIIVNPHNRVMVAKAIKQALEMPETEQRERLLAMQKRVSHYTIERWADDFLTQLQSTAEQSLVSGKQMTKRDKASLIQDYSKATSRLALLDYDGTLRDFVASPKQSLARPSRKVKSVLKRLASDPKNQIVIVSGRPKNVLNDFFEGMGLGLIAEHGGWILNAGSWVKSSLTSRKWKAAVLPILENYTARTPGSELEEKDFSLVWHFRQVAPDLAFVRAQELKKELKNALKGSDVGVYEGNKVVEVKPRRMHKGAIVTELLTSQQWDFVMAIGDDYTDEDMFRALPERAYTINVGERDSSARFQLGTVQEVVTLLDSLPTSEGRSRRNLIK
ncbi:MAG TPA: bifunctional alpha,alpha-trehalose-phosphate synthase (UDP-forming)/trehalose-phosphatase [Candidatus Saccharimonadales bacterium]|nr:bifunctional alpha,alpha-trehalose-phosphate synthase (UDP-forming)/trehalose-phosphatase [Candidatus Saccharimonadales bacterium]